MMWSKLREKNRVSAEIFKAKKKFEILANIDRYAHRNGQNFRQYGTYSFSAQVTIPVTRFFLAVPSGTLRNSKLLVEQCGMEQCRVVEIGTTELRYW